ncbi:MAG: hypothetical protein IKH54_01545 [Bacilli bacterium]|nr:hypothetical protein [Bacilli bacterium]
MKNKKKIIIIGIAIVLLIVGIVLVIINNNSNNMKKTLEKVNNLALKGATKNELSKIFRTEELESDYMLTGPDCYMRLKPTEAKVKEYNLSNYIKEQDKLSKTVEKSIEENFFTLINDTTTKENNATVYSGVVRTFYQLEYLQDLKELQKLILTEYKENNTLNEDIDNYKAKVVAMKILDKKLDNYKNKDEYSGFNIYVYEDDTKTGSSFVSYMNMLQGINYHNDDVNKLEETREQRIKDYLEEAKNNNTVNKDSILEI